MARATLPKGCGVGCLGITVLIGVVESQQPPQCNVQLATRTWTNEEDFLSGFKINARVIDDPYPDSSLTIVETPQLLDDIWIACSNRGTIVRIDTDTREILGEYLTSPRFATGSSRCPHNPSRTTVDFDGNIWAGNRNDTDFQGTVVKIGSGFAFQWVDRDNGKPDR